MSFLQCVYFSIRLFTFLKKKTYRKIEFNVDKVLIVVIDIQYDHVIEIDYIQ